MILPVEYSWLEPYLDNDALWLEDSLNWDEVFDLTFADFNFYSILTTPFFFVNQIFVDSQIKLSFLDILFLLETDKINYSRELYDSFLWDLVALTSNKFLSLHFLFYTDYQDFLIVLLYYAPELVFALTDYINIYWINNVSNYTIGAVYDTFSDILNSTVSEFVEYFFSFAFYAWIIIFFIDIFRLIKWDNPLEVYMVRLFNYFYSAAKLLRMQFEVMLQIVFFIFFYWSMMATVFDDDQEELIENFHSSLFSFFCVVVAYVFYKYSIHYFAFLEPSSSEERSVAFITKQFLRDFINTFALLLRFFILLFRLNIYDTLDDFFDSYYIFVGDFDDDEYFDELFFSVYGLMFYDTDVHDDRLYSLEEESDLFMDLFYVYFLTWGKFFMFLFVIMEILLRISLALYVCYLITFDVHAVNNSYLEDTYIQAKRELFNKSDKQFL